MSHRVICLYNLRKYCLILYLNKNVCLKKNNDFTDTDLLYNIYSIIDFRSVYFNDQLLVVFKCYNFATIGLYS